MNKKVFVVIVTYNGARWIDKNITSLLGSGYPVSIIAVDNNSADNSVALLQKYPQVHVIQSAENLGFGKANNIGMQKALDAGADYVFLLNQDAWVFEPTIASLVAKMEANPKYGIISPMHYSADETRLDKSFKKYYKKAGSQYRQGLATVPFVNAAAWMISKKCLEKTGMFEPAFSHYGEDRNYCDRVAYHGFKIGIDEQVCIVHDRVITRNFNKDAVQSRYKILCTLLNINHSLAKSYYLAAKEAAGLPKYFSKHYSKRETATLFRMLMGYYLKMVFSVKDVTAIRKKSR